ncbi:MAG: molecular chaperone DnaJ [archaeon]
MSKDYYAKLGLDKNASPEDIKKAYKRLAKQHHPDINKETGSAEKFKEINEAYATLGDENKRANYDRFGTADQGFQGFSGDSGGFGFEDIFEGFFGGDIFGGRNRAGRNGADLKCEIELEFEEAAFGVKKEVELSRSTNCEDCKGTGAENAAMYVCPDCNGKGRRKSSIRTPFGIISQTTTCSNCRGHGETPKKECKNCKGQGRKKQKKTITIKIPPGVDNGSTLRVSGEGDAGESGCGDLYVEMYVKPHKVFEREKNNVLLTIPISFSQAALGTEIDIPTLGGETSMKIPAGTQSHTIFRMSGKGIEDVHTRRKGDQLVKILVKTPTSLNRTQKEILKKLAEKKEEIKPEKDFFTKFKEKFV